MMKKLKTMGIFFAFISILLFPTPSTLIGNATNIGNEPQNEKVNTTTDNQTFNTTTGTRIIYNVNKVVNDTNNYLTVNNHDQNTNTDYVVGNITQGDIIGFDFNYYGNNGTYDFVVGQVNGPKLDGSAELEYYFVNPNDTLTTDQGPPMLYFVIPNINVTQSILDLQSANFTATSSNDLLDVSETWQPSSGGVSTIHVTWKLSTGIMQFYNFTSTGGNYPVVLTLSFQDAVNPGNFNPTFAYQNPIMFINIATLQIGNSNTLEFMNDPNSFGSISQGQNALISLSTWTDTNGPNYEGMMQSTTGSSYIQNPFGNNSNNNNNGSGGPPDLVFIFPTSSEIGWWGNISLYLSIDGLETIASNSTTLTLQQTDPHNSNNNVTLILNKADGFLLSYKLLTVDAFTLPGTNTFGIFNMELKFIKGYDFNIVNQNFKISSGKQYKYHIDQLSIAGNHTTDADVGYFKEGQDMNILFDTLTFGNNGPDVVVTMSTPTGQVPNNQINYDIFNQSSDGPLLFIPVLPFDANGLIFSYLTDVFQIVAGGTVTNNATVFEISINNMQGGDILINHLDIAWNKSNGVMLSYYYDAQNPTNSTQRMILKMHYLSDSTGQNISSTSSTQNTVTSSPGFEYTLLFLAIIPVVMFTRKRRSI